MGVADHLAFFRAINPAAVAFGIAFIVQGALLSTPPMRCAAAKPPMRAGGKFASTSTAVRVERNSAKRMRKFATSESSGSAAEHAGEHVRVLRHAEAAAAIAASRFNRSRLLRPAGGLARSDVAAGRLLMSRVDCGT